MILMALSCEREQELWTLCSQGDIEAREELIIEYRPLVLWIARKIYTNSYELRQDLIQEGMLALINAVDKFQPEREYKFSTYAYHKIHGQMINLLERSEKKAPLPVPDEWLQTADDDLDTSDEDWLDAADAVSRLQGQEAEVVNAIFFEGKNAKDIAAEKKLNVSHVYRLRRSAIARIRGWLGLSVSEGV